MSPTVREESSDQSRTVRLACTAVAILLIGLPPRVMAQTHAVLPCTGAPSIRATVRRDNDISYSTRTGDSVAIPTPVARKMYAIAAEACFQMRANSNDSMPLASFYDGAFLVKSTQGYSVYALNIRYYGAETLHFLLYDSATAQISPDPVPIYAKWARDDDGVCERPFVSFDDLAHDGYTELVIRERTHNGTSYNACVRHYYSVGRDLSLNPMLAVEERSLIDLPGPEDNWVLRRINVISRDSLTVATFESLSGKPERKVGEVLLSRHPTAQCHCWAYREIDSTVVDPRYRNTLITDSPSHDENFILTGRTLWY